MDQKKRLLLQARNLFLELGYSRVSMDEIAGNLGMSKRTIYQLVPNKRELLRQCLLDKVAEISAGLDDILGQTDQDFLTKLRAVGLYMLHHLPRPSRHFLIDIQQSCPDIWLELDSARQEIVARQFSRLFEEGKEQGILRKEIDSALLMKAFTGMIQSTIRPEVMAHLSISIHEAFHALLDLVCRGVLTEDGRSNYLQTSEEEGS